MGAIIDTESAGMSRMQRRAYVWLGLRSQQATNVETKLGVQKDMEQPL